jgi:hypothetical protein
LRRWDALATKVSGVESSSGCGAREGISVAHGSFDRALNEGTFSFVPNPLILGEMTIETGGSAESSGNGLSIHALPREGANGLSFMTTGLFSNGPMQSDNLTNSAALLTTNVTYGGQWRNPTTIVNGRLAQLSARMTF